MSYSMINFIHNSKGVENMFPEYVRWLPDPEDEPRCEKNIEDSFESQFHRILNTLRSVLSFQIERTLKKFEQTIMSLLIASK